WLSNDVARAIEAVPSAQGSDADAAAPDDTPAMPGNDAVRAAPGSPEPAVHPPPIEPPADTTHHDDAAMAPAAGTLVRPQIVHAAIEPLITLDGLLRLAAASGASTLY